MPQTLYREVKCAGQPTQRQKVLLLQKSEWDNYKGLIVKDATLLAHAQAQHEKREAVKTLSQALRKTWRNTTENARNQQLQARADRLAADQKEKEDRSLEMQKIRAEERQQYLDECRKLIYYRQEEAKVFNSALVLSETLRERELQKELERKIKAAHQARHQEWVDGVFKDVDEFHKEEREKSGAARVKMYKYRDRLVKQIEDTEATKKREAKIEMALAQEDIARGLKEMELATRLELEEKKRAQNVVKEDFVESTENARIAKELKKKQEDDENQVIFVYADTIERIEARRKKTLAETREAMNLRRETIAKRVGVVQASKDEAENRAIQQAIAERDAKEEVARLKREAYAKKIREERIASFNDYRAAEELRKEREKDVLKWETLQRYKTEEVDKEFFERKRQKHADGLMENRLMLEAAIAQKKEEEKADVFDLHGFYKEKYEKQDREFLAYADEVLEDSKQKGRMLYPMQKVLVEYKEKNGLVKKEKKRTLHISHVPCGEARKVAVPQICDCRVGTQNLLD